MPVKMAVAGSGISMAGSPETLRPNTSNPSPDPFTFHANPTARDVALLTSTALSSLPSEPSEVVDWTTTSRRVQTATVRLQ